jgi:uncharacterized protein YjbI with pentapeptide repeats
MNQTEINEIVRKHRLWLKGREGGSRADFTGRNLCKVDFTGRDLRSAIFTDAILHGAVFTNSTLIGVNFTNAKLTDANLSCAILHYANFTNADLTNVNFSYSVLTDIDFTNAILNGANLYRTTLNGANFTNTNILILQHSEWTVYIHADTLQIENHHYSHDKWLNFNDDEIQEIDSNMLEWWKKYKPFIISGIEFIKTQEV